MHALYQDEDIDWTSASSDFGLAQLCREMAALATPVSAVANLTTRRRRAKLIAPRVRLSQAAPSLGQLELA